MRTAIRMPCSQLLEFSDLIFRQTTPLATGQVIEIDRAETDPFQMHHTVSYRFKHPAHLPVTAFMDGHQHIRGKRFIAHHSHLCRRSQPSIEVHACAEPAHFFILQAITDPDQVLLGHFMARMQQMLGADYVVKDRYEQQEDTFKIMQIEKLISYIFLTFILMIACFNIIGSLSMLIIDKKQDALTLRNLGANEGQIRSIFMFEGRMICLLGAVTGILVGLTLCWLQQEFGLIRFGSSEGSYIINAYPVSVRWMDLLLIFVTVIAVGFLSVWYPVRRLSRKMMTSNL